MRVLIWGVVAAVLALPARAEVATVPLAQDFQGIGYSISSSGNVAVYAAARQMGDKLAICGAVVFEKATNTTMAIEKQFTEHVRFELAGQVVKVQTDLFTRYRSEAAAKLDPKAGCAPTNKPWNAAYAKTPLKLSLGSVTVMH